MSDRRSLSSDRQASRAIVEHAALDELRLAILESAANGTAWGRWCMLKLSTIIFGGFTFSLRSGRAFHDAKTLNLALQMTEAEVLEQATDVVLEIALDP